MSDSEGSSPESQPKVPRQLKSHWKSYNDTLKSVHLPSALNSTSLDFEVEDGDSSFHSGIEHWREICVQPQFHKFTRTIEPLCRSLPLLLHNWKKICDEWMQTADKSDEETLHPLLELLQRLAHDLRSTLLPLYPALLSSVLNILPMRNPPAQPGPSCGTPHQPSYTATPRKLSPQSLTSVLQTLSSLFRYILVPSSASNLIPLIKPTWQLLLNAMCGVLRRKGIGASGEEIERMLAECWGSFVRRIKKDDARQVAVALLVEDLERCEVGVAWVLINALQSASNSFHPTAPAILSVILSHYLTVSSHRLDAFVRLLRRVLTSCTNHATTSKHFEPLSKVLSDVYADTSLETASRMWTLLAIVSGAKGGVLVPSKQTSASLSKTVDLLSTTVLHELSSKDKQSLLEYTCTSLMSGDLSTWIGAGKRTVDRLWEMDALLGLQLALVLSELQFGGWSIILRPHVERQMIPLLKAEQFSSKTLGLLAALNRSGRLNDFPEAKWLQLSDWVASRLRYTSWNLQNDADVLDLISISSLAPHLQSEVITPPIQTIIGSVVDTYSTRTAAKANFSARSTNAASVLGSCYDLLANAKGDEVDLVTEGILAWTQATVHNFGWSDRALNGLVKLLRNRSHISSLNLPCFGLLDELHDSVLSPYQSLRLAALGFLLLPQIERSPSEDKLLRRLLSVEEIPIDFESFKDRVHKTTSLITDGGDLDCRIAAPWLLAQLKVNLRPLWAPSIKVLSSLMHSNSRLGWQLVFQEVRRTGVNQDREVDLESLGVLNAPWMQKEGEEAVEYEEEPIKSWNDEDRRNIASVIRDSVLCVTDGAFRDLVKLQTPLRDLDVSNYEIQLLTLLADVPRLAEQNHRDIVPFFLQQNSPPMPRLRLSPYLTVFSKFKNPAVLPDAEALRSFYTACISEPDRPLQRQALACIYAFKSIALTPYEDQLSGFLDARDWRSAVGMWNFEEVADGDRDEVIPVAIRLLYGLLLNRKGGDKTANSRTAILGVLGRLRAEELAVLVDLMLRPFDGLQARSESFVSTKYVVGDVGKASKTQMNGFLLLLADVLRVLGPQLRRYWAALFSATLDIATAAQREIDHVMELDDAEMKDSGEDAKSAHADDSSVEGRDEDNTPRTPLMTKPDSIEKPKRLTQPSTKIARGIRKLAFQRLQAFFTSPIAFDYGPFMPAAFSGVISPRLSKLHGENTTSAGSFLPLIKIWSQDLEYVPFLQDYDPALLPTLFTCLGAEHLSFEAATQIFDVVENILENCGDDTLRARILIPNLRCLLDNLALMVERRRVMKSDAAVQRQVEILSLVAPFVSDPAIASRLFNLLLPALKRSPKVINEKFKANILRILGEIVPLIPQTHTEAGLDPDHYDLFSSLLGSITLPSARTALVTFFERLSLHGYSSTRIQPFLADLNVYPNGAWPPSMDHQLAALASLNESGFMDLTASEWHPILQNITFILRTTTEFPCRNAASLSIRRLLESAGQSNSNSMRELFSQTVYPALLEVLQSSNDDSRAEALSLLSFAAERIPDTAVLHDFGPLLMKGQKDANVFLNLYHVQTHSRLRALRRIGEACEGGHLGSSALIDVFVPVINDWIMNSSKQDLVDEAITTLGKMAAVLSWQSYHGVLRRYLALTKASASRAVLRGAVAILEHFHFDMKGINSQASSPPQIDDSMDVDPVSSARLKTCRLESTKAYATVKGRLLPELLDLVEVRDEKDDKARIPLAAGIVHIGVHLPAEEREPMIRRLIIVLSQTLRSKSTDIRFLARDALIKVVTTTGFRSLSPIVKELKMVLTRGPQLHILASVVHSLLKHATSSEKEDLQSMDSCAMDAAEIAAEVVFGESAANTQSEGFKSTVKEVTGSSKRGQEIFEILARHVNPTKIAYLLQPVRAILAETVSLRMTNLSDDVLRRIAVGFNGNQNITPQDVLSLCHTLITQNARFLSQAPRSRKNKGYVRRDVEVDLKVQRVQTGASDHFASNSFRFVVFGLELFVNAYRKGRLQKDDPDMLARLEPLVAIIEDTLSSSESKVVSAGLRALTAVVRFPLRAVAMNLRSLTTKVLDIVQQAGNSESNLVQMALKTLASLLRDCPTLSLEQSELTFILTFVLPDVEESTRQETVFALIQALILRKFLAPEIYDIMDKTASVMVTSHSTKTQALARNVFLLFVTDYPQGKARMKSTMEFLAKNLAYEHESGRKSVMLLLIKIFETFKLDLLHQYSNLFFCSLTVALANDESPACRQLCNALITSLFERQSAEQHKEDLAYLHVWTRQSDRISLRHVAVQLQGLLLVAAGSGAASLVDTVVNDIQAVLRGTFLSGQCKDSGAAEALGDIWQLPHQALLSLVTVFKTCPHILMAWNEEQWRLVESFQVYPQSSVRLVVLSLQGILFARNPPEVTARLLADEHPLSRKRLTEAAKSLMEQLHGPYLTSEISLQTVKNLFYIGRVSYLLIQPGGPSDDSTASQSTTHPHGPEDPSEELLTFLFSRMSSIARRSVHERRVASSVAEGWIDPPSAAIRWFAAMTSHMIPSVLVTYLTEVITPVVAIVDLNFENDAIYAELKTLAMELQQILQAKVGATEYGFAYKRVKDAAKTAREGRKAQQVLMSTRDPEAYAKRRKHQLVIKRESRKRKAEAAIKGRDTKKYRNW